MRKALVHGPLNTPSGVRIPALGVLRELTRRYISPSPDLQSLALFNKFKDHITYK
jgi:hypothetical protein